MLLRFYIAGLLIFGILFLFAWFKHQKELLKRLLTLTLLLHIFCFALYSWEFVFIGLMVILLAVAVFELASIYDIFPLFTALATIGISIFLIPHVDILSYIAPFFLLIALATYILNKKIISTSIFFFVFYFTVLIPCALALIGIYKLDFEMIIVLLLLLQLNDGFGLLFGKKFGRRRIFPVISPNKTLEGYFCGLSGIILGICLLHTAVPILRGNTLFQDIFLIGYIFIFGNAGDLLFSTMKRKLEIKDFSSMLPGHGGILDRFDSIFFASPFLFLIVKYGMI
jgi:phosphatidate cytidylyltransferase